MRMWITFVRLMDVSERSMWRTDAQPDYYRAPVFHVLDDGPSYQRWETTHARLMRPVADARRYAEQTVVLRRVALRLIHRRAFIDYLRTAAVRGALLERLFAVFYGPTDFRQAVIREHAQYMLAAASGYCIEVLVDSVEDTDGCRMLERYQVLYQEYFGLFGRFIAAELTGDVEIAAAVQPAMLAQRARAERLRQAIVSVPPRDSLLGRTRARPALTLILAGRAA